MVKNLPAKVGDAGNTRDMSLAPGSRRCPGVGNGYPLQCSCLGNSMDRGAWLAIVHGVTKNWTQLGEWAHTPASYVSEAMAVLRRKGNMNPIIKLILEWCYVQVRARMVRVRAWWRMLGGHTASPPSSTVIQHLFCVLCSDEVPEFIQFWCGSA